MWRVSYIGRSPRTRSPGAAGSAGTSPARTSSAGTGRTSSRACSSRGAGARRCRTGRLSRFELDARARGGDDGGRREPWSDVEHREGPSGGLGGSAGGVAPPRAPRAVQHDLERAQRPDPPPGRLHERLLRDPVAVEGELSSRLDRIALGWREEAAGNPARGGGARLDLLEVDTDLHVAHDADQRQAGRVRQVEADACAL